MRVDEKPTVVVECILTDNPIQTLRLSFTSADGTQREVQEAEAVLTDLTVNSVAGTFSRNAEGCWTLDYKAVSGHKYRLEIKVPGYDLIYAEDTMPQQCVVHSAMGFLSNKASNVIYGSVFRVPTGSYKMWVYAMNYNKETGRREIVERICTDAAGVDDFNLTGESYDPPHSDFDNIFGVSRDAYLYWELEGCPLHNKYLRVEMEPGKFSNSLSDYIFSVSGSFEGDYYNRGTIKPSERPPREDEGVVLVTIVSDKYDRFLRDVHYFMHLAESTELASIYLRDNLYTNIEGGVGIFGAKSERYVEWFPAYTARDIRNEQQNHNSYTDCLLYGKRNDYSSTDKPY